MALLGHLMVLAFVMMIKAQTYEWKDIENSCTRLKAEGNIKDIIGIFDYWYWSYPSDKCATLSIVPQEDNTYLGTFSVDKENPKYDFYHEEDLLIANPDNAGQLEFFSKNGTGPIRVVTLIASVPNVGYAGAVCDFEAGNVNMRLYVLASPSATEQQIEDLKNKVAAEVSDIPLNPVTHGEDCKKSS
ncbi:hypothetical protein CHUAL_000170 [Chamberlinius hualienensis]